MEEIKLLLKEGKKVKYGDTITLQYKEGDEYNTIDIVATDDVIRHSIITKGVWDYFEIPDLDFFKIRAMQMYNMSMETFNELYTSLLKVSPESALLMMLKVIAIWMDKGYEDHISNSEEIWTVSMLNGSIYQVNKNYIRNYKGFPAFRSKREVQHACLICRELLRKVFRSGKRKQKD